jgi:hypothetical protein
MTKKNPGLYANINARKKAGTSRPKSKCTVETASGKRVAEYWL